MKKFITLENVDGQKETFEIKKNLKEHITCRDIYNCYKNPSYIKQNVFEYWREFADGSHYMKQWHNLNGFGILSHNTSFFTLGFYANLVDVENGNIIQVYCKITPNHNYCKIVKE